MMSAAERLIEATLPFTLRPKKKDREKLIAAALRFVIEEFQEYEDDGCGEMIISCRDLWEIIQELEEDT